MHPGENDRGEVWIPPPPFLSPRMAPVERGGELVTGGMFLFSSFLSFSSFFFFFFGDFRRRLAEGDEVSIVLSGSEVLMKS